MLCCTRCRLLQPAATTCRQCVHASLVAPQDLANPRVVGITAITKKPATGFRDFLALTATGLGMVFGGAFAGIVIHPVAGLFALPAVAAFGYTKQFWKTALRRRDRVSAIDLDTVLIAPDNLTTGIARPFKPTDTIAVAHALMLDGRILQRSIELAPFWLVVKDGKLYVSGEVWLWGQPEILDRAAATRWLVDADLALTRRDRRRVQLQRVTLRDGDSISIRGTPTSVHVQGDGYRDSLTTGFTGEPGVTLHIERTTL